MTSLGFVINCIGCSGRQTASNTSIIAVKPLEINIVIVGRTAPVVNEGPPKELQWLTGPMALRMRIPDATQEVLQGGNASIENEPF